MRAALYRSTGPAAEVLAVEDVETPEPGPGQVRVRVAVSAINPTDWKSRRGLTPRPIDGFQVPHLDGSGVIDAVGAGVDAGRVGERVWLWMAAVGKWGTAAEYSVVRSEQAVPLPAGASDELGASLGVPAMTAYHCLTIGGALDGRTVLVAGGAGAVGHYAIELAKHLGARVVTTVSGPAKAELAAAAGADLVVNYRDDDAAEQIRAFTPSVDLVVEVALGANLDLDLAVSGPGTTIVTYAAESPDPALRTRALMTANATLRFVLLYTIGADALAAAASGVSGAVGAGALSELPAHWFPLADVVAAHEAAEAGVTGKILLRP